MDIALLGAGGQLGRTLIADWRRTGTDISEAGEVTAEPGSACANPNTAKLESAAAPITAPNSAPISAPNFAQRNDSAGKPEKEQADRLQFRLHSFDRSQLDICQPGQLAERLSAIKPRLIVNAAAYTQVDKAETEREQAMQINRDGPASLARWAAQNDCRLVHVSTDFVFAGDASRPYKPAAETGPLGQYGQSKAEGEQAVQREHPDGSLIVRTGWLYSRYLPNFVTTMLRLMAERDHLRVVADQVGTPTSTHSLVRLLGLIAGSDVSHGLYHWSDAGVASWYDFAVAIQEEALATGLLSTEIPIEPIKTADYPTPARRPAYSVLDKSDSYATFGMAAVHWRRELRRVIAEINDGR